MIYFILEKTC